MRKTLLLLLVCWSMAVSAAGVDFTIDDPTSGESHQLADYRGKWVVVNYWATWCPPCREEIPELVLFHDKHKDSDAVVVGVNMEELPKERLVAFLDDYLVSYPVTPMTSDDQVIGPVPGLPTTFLVNPEGRVVARQVGPVTAEGIETVMAD